MVMENFGEIQIRPPVTEKEKVDHEKREKRVEKRQEADYAGDVESAGAFLSQITREGNEYTETIPLKSDGEIDNSVFMDNAGRTLLESARSVAITHDGLKKLIDGIKDKFKNLNFSLEQNERSLTLTVENKLKKNAFAHWISGGAQQWTEPKRIVHLSEDGQFAFFDGSMTGIPVAQLEIEG